MASTVPASTDRIDRWRDLIREHFVSLDIATTLDGPFTGTVTSTPVGHLVTATVDSTQQDCVRTPGLARLDPEPYLQIGLLAAGRAVVVQDGREAVLGPGDYALYETDRPFRWHFTGDWRLHVLTWPRSAVALGADTSRAATARAFGADRLSGIVGRMLAEVVTAPPTLTDVGGARLAEELSDLVGTVAGETLRRDEVLSPRGAADLRARVDAYVREHLDDAGLNPETIARAHFVSTRALHRAFADDATTVARLVRTRRVERGRRDLLDPRAQDLSVTDVAHRCGFADLAAFSRAFKDTYHEPPSAYRRRGGA